MYEIEKQLKNLKLPDICVSDGKEYFLDPVRDKMILKTPEEVIRQESRKLMKKTKDLLSQENRFLRLCGENKKRTVFKGKDDKLYGIR